MVSKKSIQCLIDLNKKALKNAQDEISSSENILSIMSDKLCVDAQLCRTRITYHQSQSLVYISTIEDLEELIKD